MQMSFFSRSFSGRTPSWQILSLFPLEVKHLLTDESIWKARTSLQRPKTMAAAIKHKNTQPGPPLASGGGLQPPPPPTRLLDNTEHAVLLDRRGVFLNHLRPKKKTENLILQQTRNKQPEDETSKDRSGRSKPFPAARCCCRAEEVGRQT